MKDEDYRLWGNEGDGVDPKQNAKDWRKKMLAITDQETGEVFHINLGLLATLGMVDDEFTLSTRDIRFARFLERCGAEGVCEWRELPR